MLQEKSTIKSSTGNVTDNVIGNYQKERDAI